ncbi:protein of unknown function, low identity with AlpA family transcriptional regulator [Shewanella benthica]|uniref:Uncharacterized protein n=1 Tax=Shewanella benthica TaxID=43661 RepID=A0A330M238_9GAMM|nr:protein of unknown function, low identity with AlpA family transcriptional regulator [Shewanella benthica]
MVYHSYKDLEKRYQKDRRTIWRWFSKDKTLEPPKRAGKVLLGWTEEQLFRFENGRFEV